MSMNCVSYSSRVTYPMCGVATTFEPQQREIRVAHRLVLEHVNRGIAGPASAERGHERAGFNRRRAAGIDQHGLRSHARQILGFDDVARRRH